jgi:phosphatidylglycerophosphate synthase
MNWLQEYKNSLKMPVVEEIVDLIIYRPLAFLLVISLYKTKIKPDHLTLSAMAIGIGAGFFYAKGTKQGCVIGSILYLFFNILDCSDGQLARIKKNGSSIGRILDGIADYVAAIAVYAGIAVGFSNSGGQPSHFLLLIFAAGMSIIIQESQVDYFRTRFLDQVLERQNTFSDGIEEFRMEYEKIKNQKNNFFSRAVILVYLKYSQLQKRIIRKKNEEPIISTPEGYFKKNRIIIRFWVLMGPSATITTLVVCSFFCRFNIFFWVVVCGFNVLALILRIIQFQIDKSFENRRI